ncbi:diaminopimelate decarboxylase [Bartonella sp. TP]|uniref:diaminopimelate decarboxylase n=1 Tax=Bartonella sp. TP TaxID=3057550 RepID=UPI0025AEE2E5|nr:diaminopimelate decarboxylase [Bartonella sp. TP]MDN5248541.1 diaminopimelate decarboxylase [Alphaproteobacteria bacterium]WJW79538.1 diaminopimelate decarboxylase [Bartonella sp. TP]
MQDFIYNEQGELLAENVKISAIAATIGTPFYCYSSSTINKLCSYYHAAFKPIGEYLIAYAVKANSNQAIISQLGELGCGADIVSHGELKRAIHAKINPQKIIFSGVGKSIEEIDHALQLNIGCFNIESKAELELLAQRAAFLAIEARISIRVNPNIDAKTHPKIATGMSHNKFGIELCQALALYEYAAKLAYIKICGIDVHIGSQIRDLTPFGEAFHVINQFIKELNAHNIELAHVDIGGGLGIDYNKLGADLEDKDNIEQYAKLAAKYFANSGLKIICEPGRSLVGNAGILVSSVLYSKKSYNKTFIIIDAAMNDLLRPTLYNAFQKIITVQQQPTRPKIHADIVGPVCETGDYIAQDREIEMVNNGEMLAILGAGAYGAVMASTYNSRLLIPEILVKDTQFAIIRPRQSYQALLELDRLPPWQ